MNVNDQIRSSSVRPVSADGRFFQELNTALLDQSPVSATIGGRVFASESISNADMPQFQQSVSNLQSVLATIASELNLQSSPQTRMVQETAGVQGAMIASAAQSFLSRNTTLPQTSDKNVFVVPATGVPNYLGRRSKLMAVEAFDNRETRSAVLYTMAYNYTMARQDEFGETIWPTLTLPADQVGFGIVVNRLTVHRGVTHGTDGKPVDFNKVDLMRAAADSTVLLRDKTRLIPVVRASNVDKFVPAADIAPYDYDNEGVMVKTAPLRVGVEVGIIGLSQTDAMLEGGLGNQTDTMDPAINLTNLYVKVGDDILRFDVRSNPLSNFTYSPQGLDKQRNLSFTSKGIQIKPTTKQQDGTALSDLSIIATNGLTVILDVAATGTANTEFGMIQVFGNRVAVAKVLDDEGDLLPDSSSYVQDIKTAFASAAIIGYDVRAYRTNINMRERGNFIDRSSVTQLYDIPLLSPITAQRPISTDGQQDAGDFESLVTATRFYLMNDAVTAILDSCTALDEYTSSGMSNSDEIPRELGAARFHVKPVFYGPAPIDVTKIVDSWSSADRLTDLQSALINVIRDYAFRMFVKSEYQAAQAALGMQGPATIIIATDPIIHRYLMVNGDLRTMTEKFNVRVVSTLDKRMEGKVFVTFGVFDETRNQAPNILNWGNLIWSSEVVMSAPVPRGESMSRETIVQPRYRFVMHCPVATMLQFKNIPDVLLRQPIQFHNV